MSEKKLELIEGKFEKLIDSSNGKLTFTVVIALFFVLLYALIYQIVNLILTPFGVLTIVIFTILWKYVL
jgi:hypothetical protein